ncbi:MAG: hypothetical protein J6A16_10315 [Oscillospiraceae bacterium]|nr:hypothetical protein [Oscillospiraceae bacterium]
MKALVCELCGGNEFVKENSLFVCQNCGTKYSAEDAKKIMVEVDNSKKLSNLYERARKSIEVDDLEHAAEYYKEILDENPHDWEAYFYSYLGEFTTFTNSQAGSVADKLGNTIPSAYDMALEGCEISEAEKRIKLITTKTIARINGIAGSGASLLRQYEGGFILSAAGKVNSDLYSKLRPVAQNTIISCVLACDPLDNKLVEISKSGKGISEEVIKECLLIIRHAKYDMANLTFSPSAGVKEHMVKSEQIHEYALKIKELDSSFEEEVEVSKPTQRTAEQQRSLGKGFLITGCVLLALGLMGIATESIELMLIGLMPGMIFVLSGLVGLATANSMAKKERQQEHQNSDNENS